MVPPSKAASKCSGGLFTCPYHDMRLSWQFSQSHLFPCTSPTEIDVFMHLIRGIAGRVNPAPGRQLRCFAEGHFNRHDHICYVHIVRPIWFFFAPIYSGLEPCQSYWMLENINEKRANPFCAATHLLPVFTHLAFSKCLSFMFTQARPRCLGNNLLRHMM